MPSRHRVHATTLRALNVSAHTPKPVTTIRIRGYIGNHCHDQLDRIYKNHGSTVQRLDLSGSGIGPRALQFLFSGPRAWPALVSLDLTGADVTGIDFLAMPALKPLNLTNTVGHEALLEKMAGNDSIDIKV